MFKFLELIVTGIGFGIGVAIVAFVGQTIVDIVDKRKDKK